MRGFVSNHILRARPAAAFALLNHILINGFFFNQGFAIRLFPLNTVLNFVQPRKLSILQSFLFGWAIFPLPRSVCAV